MRINTTIPTIGVRKIPSATHISTSTTFIVSSGLVDKLFLKRKEKQSNKSTEEVNKEKSKKPLVKTQLTCADQAMFAIPSIDFRSAKAKIATPVIGEAAVYAPYSSITMNTKNALKGMITNTLFLSSV